METLEVIKVFILAVFQGIGEFLPISSSGHLLVLGKLFFGDSGGIDEDELMTLNILLHAGTLISILIVFRKWIWEMLTQNRRLILLLILGSIPTGIIGILIKKKCEFLLGDLSVAGLGFIITGFLLLKFLGGTSRTSRPESNGESDKLPAEQGTERKTLRTMTWLDALVIGLVQGIAVFPGISRSGSTIAAGIFRKLRSEDAAVFSFLLAIPAIGGATLLEAVDFIKENTGSLVDSMFGLYVFGAVVSLVIGVISLIYLMKWLKQGRLAWFAWWLFVIGVISLGWGFCS